MDVSSFSNPDLIDPVVDRMRIIRPGRNVWRSAKAERIAFLIDGEDYFRRLDEVLRQAEKSILIVGCWDRDALLLGMLLLDTVMSFSFCRRLRRISWRHVDGRSVCLIRIRHWRLIGQPVGFRFVDRRIWGPSRCRHRRLFRGLSRIWHHRRLH